MSTWQTIPLHGRTLIEASAGTGKTWTISALYLRLLVNTEFRPRQILVATFSEAAAEELRERIRSTLDDAIEQLGCTFASADPTAPLTQLVPEAEWPERAQPLRLRLQLAALELDQAPIGTLHSLCKRILSEHALDTGSPLSWDQLIDERQLHEDVCLDLWRQLIQGEHGTALQRRQLLSDGLDSFKKRLRALAQLDSAPLAPSAAQIDDCDCLLERHWAPALRLLAECAGVFATARSAVRGELRALADWLESDDGAPERVDSEFKNLAASDVDTEPLSKQVHKDGRDTLRQLAEFNFALNAVASLKHAARTLRGSALAALLPHYRRRYSEQLQRSEGFTYQWLIDHVAQSLTDPLRGRRFADTLFQRWPVAMVDEFQDTDAKQYAILDALYRGDAQRARGCLMMIGDPKQAIYGFRGGDLLTYQRAALACDQQMQLDTNFRASANYVDAINALYHALGDGFGGAGLRYHRVGASKRRVDTPYCVDRTEHLRPLHLHVGNAAEIGSTVDDRQTWAVESAAEQIVALLNDTRQSVANRALQAGQFAVLVPRNDQVVAMRQALRRRGIPCAGAGRSDVFTTPWAESLQLLLWAWLHPADTGALRACLLSPLFGVEFQSLRRLEQQEDGLSAYAEAFAQSGRDWQRNGVLSALMPLIDQQSPRLLADSERGERALTDLRHMGELLADAEAQGCHGEALWRWLADQRADTDQEPAEQRQLRVESDRQRVKLMTLHASKGLEFDFVLLPLMFTQTGRAIDLPQVPDADTGQLHIDLGSARYAQSVSWATEENLRERMRVLYVALTRAVYRCDVWLIDPTEQAKAPRTTDPSAIDALLQPLVVSRPRPALAGIEWRDVDAQIRLTQCLAASEPSPIVARAPRPMPMIRPLQRQLSFSSLAHAGPNETRRAEDELAPFDAAIDAPSATDLEPHPILQQFGALRGTQFGNALHGMFENRQLKRGFAEQHALIRDQLRAFGLSPIADVSAWVERIAERLDQILNTPIRPGLCLADLNQGDQQAELDFRMSLDRLSLRQLRQVCQRHADDRLLPQHWRDESLRGLLVGKIDLVFSHHEALHVLDYKSNFLGLTLADYQVSALHGAMDQSAYRFQALLYTVAVHRYLRQRRGDYDPNRHLGEACYLFLRAVGLSPHYPDLGIWRHRFSLDLIEGVDAVLADEVEVSAA